ncbi:MAG: DUF1501 domain-containing protein [Oscillochloridaceae bacterium]|nr:DUF1501 domain-containing protein [Chloroflexaceae bacterium]MDW8391394.1 DUF1501 domain-containing protein [Oscillochloridaceae bacterium]
MEVTRREFLVGCSAAIAALAAGRVSQLIFADPVGAAGSDEILVVVFLRGGCDGLSLLCPYDDPAYRQARGTLALPLTGQNAPLRIDPRNPSYGASSFGLNSKMPHLRELYDAGRLAMIHACGLNDDTRSHFDAMDYMERGTPGNKTTGSGWITRHLQTSGLTTGLLPAVSAGNQTPASLLAYRDAVAMSNPRSFTINTHWRYNRPEESYPLMRALENFYPGSGLNPVDVAGRRTIETIKAIRAANPGNYTPRDGVTYPGGSFGNALRTVAQLVKMEQGLRIATVDLGGWDTHENQAYSDGTGYLPDRLGMLSQGLFALYSDLVDYQNRLTIVVMSEFGRRLGRNASNGTDHGHGNVMLVLGGGVNGGRVYGQWPGLVDLDQGQDLRITTDFRVVLGEIILRRLGNPNLGAIFPGLTAQMFQPLGLVSGVDPGPIIWSGAADEEPALPEQRRDLPQRLYLPVTANC